MTDTITIAGRNVRRIGFGAMRLTGWEAPTGADRAHAVAVARRAVDLGVNFFDTADSYALGANEELIAEALHPYPADLVIATKAGQSRPGGRWVPLGRPEYLSQQAELSLRRLRLDRLPLFQLHRVDPLVPFEDQIGALVELREQGKIEHIGLSEVSVDQLDAARRLTEIASVQNLYNLSDRRHDPVVDHCERLGIPFLPWLPIAGGRVPDPTVVRIAGELNATPQQVALAWLLRRSRTILPIPGTSSPEHLADNVAAADITLSEEHLKPLT